MVCEDCDQSLIEARQSVSKVSRVNYTKWGKWGLVLNARGLSWHANACCVHWASLWYLLSAVGNKPLFWYHTTGSPPAVLSFLLVSNMQRSSHLQTTCGVPHKHSAACVSTNNALRQYNATSTSRDIRCMITCMRKSHGAACMCQLTGNHCNILRYARRGIMHLCLVKYQIYL